MEIKIYFQKFSEAFQNNAEIKNPIRKIIAKNALQVSEEIKDIDTEINLFQYQREHNQSVVDYWKDNPKGKNLYESALSQVKKDTETINQLEQERQALTRQINCRGVIITISP